MAEHLVILDVSNSADSEPTSNRRLRKRSYIAYLHRLQNNGRDSAEGSQNDQDADSLRVSSDGSSMAMEPQAREHAAALVTPTNNALGGVVLASDVNHADPPISNPIHEPERLFAPDRESPSSQQFVGESTCLAFGDRILQCLCPQSAAVPLSTSHKYMRDPAFARQLDHAGSCTFPERIRAHLLVRVALRFIGQDYHLFLHHDFLDKLAEAYASGQALRHESMWVCKFFVVLALGEMYSASLPAAKEARPASVPGTQYFLTAVRLFQDQFEEPSIAQIETLLLFMQCFYSNVLGRVKSAHMYSGMAVRSSTCLGLHRRVPDSSTLSATEREHRIRLWWTVYVFDRSTCSKLGQPLSIQDSDIDVGMPSSDMLSPDGQAKLGSPDHLIAYINLAQITGYIMRDIYAPASKASGGRLVQNVRTILQKLRKWDSHVSARLRWRPEGGVPRSVASLQLHFNQCIILTTRPILLYVLKMRNPFALHRAFSSADGDAGDGGDAPAISDTIRSLADSCVAAARTSNTILSQLFIENALATCGYFDAHHLFSSTLVMIVSAISSPNSCDSDAVQTAFQILMVMRDNGNVAAGEYFSCLAKIQWTVSRLFQGRTAREAAAMDMEARAGASACTPAAPNPVLGPPDLDDYDWSQFVIPHSLDSTSDHDGPCAAMTGDPLDNPLLQAFLDNSDGGRDENNLFNTDDIFFML
ncbi:hypothetical protein VTK73DRAFT_9900 [Phialemonium thermophilum]|uniref:Xylanolytic transcriptional activator regulatory domain-containing protein n=1 Tax=Phialemonium thermophilum TaxID=223376 RepID=A0ABR3XJ15_9PEZI